MILRTDIAFSSSYISSRSAGIKISNTIYQVHNLRHNEGWVVSTPSSPVEDSSKDFKLKICTVISGQVQVRLGNDGFVVSKGSVFRVRSGEDCVVRNGEKKVAVIWVVCVE
jgi:mannose-6-phosphate isomerase class I